MAIKTFTTNEMLTASDTNTYLANSGLVFVKSTDFTSASSASPANITSCFSSTYTNYRVVLNTSSATANVAIRLQLLSGTTPATTTWYRFAATGSTQAAAVSNNGSGNNSFLELTLTAQNGTIACDFDVFSPNENRKTNFFGDWLYDDGSTFIYRRYGCIHDLVAIYDGFRIYPDTGSITGNVTVYGYRKS